MTFERGIIRSAKLYSLKRFLQLPVPKISQRKRFLSLIYSKDFERVILVIRNLIHNLFKYKKTLNSYISAIDRDEAKKKLQWHDFLYILNYFRRRNSHKFFLLTIFFFFFL